VTEDVVPFFVVCESSGRSRQYAIPFQSISLGKQAFATLPEAEEANRNAAEIAAQMGVPVPEFRVVEAATINDAFIQLGIPPPTPQQEDPDSL
jgi:hypothetical protein